MKYEFDEPISLNDILFLFPNYTRAYVFRLIKKYENEGKIVKFSRGVYYLPRKTVLGRSMITSLMVAENKYVHNGKEVYGLFSGLSLLNSFTISTQIPNTIEIVTNKEATRKRMVTIDGMNFILRKSRFEITKDNYNYYQLLQLFLELGNNQTLDSFSKQKITEYIKDNKIKTKQLIQYAMFFPAQTLKNLLNNEVINGTI